MGRQAAGARQASCLWQWTGSTPRTGSLGSWGDIWWVGKVTSKLLPIGEAQLSRLLTVSGQNSPFSVTDSWRTWGGESIQFSPTGNQTASCDPFVTFKGQLTPMSPACDLAEPLVSTPTTTPPKLHSTATPIDSVPKVTDVSYPTFLPSLQALTPLGTAWPLTPSSPSDHPTLGPSWFLFLCVPCPYCTPWGSFLSFPWSLSLVAEL